MRQKKDPGADALTFIAVAYNGKGEIPNFEQTETFWGYYLKGKRIKKRQFLSLRPRSTEDLIEQFRASMFDMMICRNYGPKAMHRLKEAGIRLYTFDGGSGAAVRAYLRGELREL